ncbi:MAG: NTP transferase domain-containing protein [Pseudomonadota bacterium]
MKKTAIIQARMSSTRLSGKILMEIGNHPMIGHSLMRLKKCRQIDEIILATSTQKDDDCLADIAQTYQINLYRGPLDDVLRRYVGAATQAKSDIILRVTSDCPFLDSGLIDEVLKDRARFNRHTLDRYVTTHHALPRGLDACAFSFDLLKLTHQQSSLKRFREHVTLYFTDGPYPAQKIEIGAPTQTQLKIMRSLSNKRLRWCVDEQADLEAMRALFNHAIKMGFGTFFDYQQAIKVIKDCPSIALINRHVRQKKP